MKKWVSETIIWFISLTSKSNIAVVSNKMKQWR